jgi:hypothetical protein
MDRFASPNSIKDRTCLCFAAVSCCGQAQQQHVTASVSVTQLGKLPHAACSTPTMMHSCDTTLNCCRVCMAHHHDGDVLSLLCSMPVMRLHAASGKLVDPLFGIVPTRLM